MKWARVEHNGNISYGLVNGEQIDTVRGTPFDDYELTGEHLPIADVTWLPPVIPANFYCVGLNYAEHVMEAAKARGVEPNLPTQPDVGYRSANALTGHEQPIIIPPDATQRIEYEGELVCVIGRTARHLTRENALDCLLGVTIGNDVSERTWQGGDRTLWRAKNCDTFKPMGPWIDTEFDLDSMHTKVRLNGEECIDFETNNMLFGVVDYLVAMSRYMTLHPGDVLWMGTEGHPREMQAGDVVEVEITGLGVLKNPVVANPDNM
ncbi:MAG: 2-keto-4-pentenoate hydratase/2-oxohepta-3-ene-1,7-dioic acid hydratase in catechol pathway [Gammaproteobacteria bacterium]|jgi:2-keto-4-pentenoate hydratase/2-oxohepta-3-ene-1,7-dioic acid hydratase in catechol pathway